jgi:hypothetical protein
MKKTIIFTLAMVLVLTGCSGTGGGIELEDELKDAETILIGTWKYESEALTHILTFTSARWDSKTFDYWGDFVFVYLSEGTYNYNASTQVLTIADKNTMDSGTAIVSGSTLTMSKYTGLPFLNGVWTKQAGTAP